MEQASRTSAGHLPASSPVSCLSTFGVGHFGRAAQVAWIMDQVLEAFEMPSLDARLLRLGGLDTTLQEFLGVLMQQPWTGTEVYGCEAIALTIKSVHSIVPMYVPRSPGRTLTKPMWRCLP